MATLLVLALLLQDPADARPVKTWEGPKTRILAAELSFVTDAETWKWLWRRHAGPRDAAPEVDFEKNIVVANFWGPRPADRESGWSLDAARLERGQLVVSFKFEKKDAGEKSTAHPFTIVVLPKPAALTIWVRHKSERGSAMAQLALARRQSREVEEDWGFELEAGAPEEYHRFTNAEEWAKFWKRVRPDVDVPEVDFEKSMVVAACLPRLGALPVGSVVRADDSISVDYGHTIGPAVQAPPKTTGCRIVVMAASRLKLILKLTTSSFDHRESTSATRVLKELDALK